MSQLWATWWLAASSWHCARSCIMFHEEFFGKTSNHPGDSALLQPRFGALWLLAFPKTKITFERDEISDRQWDSGKYGGAADGDWENCEVPGCEVLWRGLRHHWPMYNVSCIFFSKCLFLIVHGWILSGQILFTWKTECCGWPSFYLFIYFFLEAWSDISKPVSNFTKQMFVCKAIKHREHSSLKSIPTVLKIPFNSK